MWLENAYLIVHVGSGITSLALALYFFSIFRQRKIYNLLLLVFINFMFSLTNFTVALPEILEVFYGDQEFLFNNYVKENWRVVDVIGVLSILFTALLFVSMIVFLDYYEGDLTVRRSALGFGIFYGTIFIMIASWITTPALMFSIEEASGALTVIVWSGLVWFFLLIPSILITYWAYKDFGYSMKHVQSSRKKQQLRMIRIGFLNSFLFGPVVSSIGDSISSFLGITTIGAFIAEIVGYTIVSIGVFLVSIAYLKGEQYSLYQSQQLEHLFVFLPTGIPIYEYMFGTKRLGIRTELLSSLLAAIQFMVTESLGSYVPIQSIRLENREIILTRREEVVFALITENASLFLRNALSIFSEVFLLEFLSLENVGKGEIPQKSQVDELVRSIFGSKS